VKTIHKFAHRACYFQDNDTITVIPLPTRATFLKLAEVLGGFYTWWEVDPNVESVDKTFAFFGTGQEIPIGWKHLGTVLPGQDLVWHLYQKEWEGTTNEV
jgi:hypothetical protein